MTTRFPDINEFAVYGPFDKNKGNLERLVIVPNTYIDLARYVVMLGVAGPPPGDTARVLTRFSYSFPNQIIGPDTWIYLFTGPGHDGQSSVPDSQGGKRAAYILHWGLDHTVFISDDIVPVVIEIGKIWVGQGPNRNIALPEPQQFP